MSVAAVATLDLVNTNNHNGIGNLQTSSTNLKSDTVMSTASTTTSSGSSNSICRVIAIDDDDSRECPSQAESEVEREDIYELGIDERQNKGQPKHYTVYKSSFLQRVAGLRRQQNTHSYRERRDCNSFDSHDSDAEEQSVNQITQQSCQSWGNSQQQARHGGHLVDTASRNLILAPLTSNNLNKRKTPSPVLGIEPAPVSVEPLWEEAMDTEDLNNAGMTHLTTTATSPVSSPEVPTHADIENYSLSPRRVSLSPVARRLALQFDTISFFSPGKPSCKRRKLFD